MKKHFFRLGLLFCIYSCTNTSENTRNANILPVKDTLISDSKIVKDTIISSDTLDYTLKTKVNNQEDFNTFYKKFHTDSVFQLQRIIFPMSGFEGIGDDNPFMKRKPFVWTRENWQLNYLPLKTDPNLKLVFKVMDSLKVEEQLYIPNTEFLNLRTFECKKGKWFLSNYYDRN